MSSLTEPKKRMFESVFTGVFIYAIKNVHNAQKITINFVKFVNTYLGGHAIIILVTPQYII